jgi:aerobic-type carbon monoxide dehydrogenase small subunit (CoxS/CutS family)
VTGQWIDEDQAATVHLDVNGRALTVQVPPRRTLADALRDHGLTGTHLGCEHGVCGACTILLDGFAVRACLMLAVQAEGAKVQTIEEDTPELTALRRAFDAGGALQCGFCTPGFLMVAAGLLRNEPKASPERVLEVVSSNLCRCTGGVPIVAAVLAAQSELAGSAE